MKKQNQTGMSVTRRHFLGAATTLAAFSIVPRYVLAGSGKLAPSDKMNIGCVGVGGMQGAGDVRNVAGENIYAICDVDENFLNKSAGIYPKAKKYRDFREMLDKEHKTLDGITITIPDHMHASVALWAMERGVHVHCQKPLTQSIWEARLLAKAAEKYKVCTQMGNQGYSSEATRLACEYVWNGDIGEVTEVHAMSGGGFARDIKTWPAAQPVPPTLDWNLWTGRAPEHPYSTKIHPSNWRGFLDYGTQMVGDWGIHILGPANWALQLGSPTSVECTAVAEAEVNPITYPPYIAKFEFPARPNKFVAGGKMPPVTIYWYEGAMARTFQAPKTLPVDPPSPDSPPFKYNQLFIGTKGFMGTNGRGESVRLLPESKAKDHKKPPTVIKRSPGHFKDWINACKGGDAACSNFSIASPFTEWLLLGAISWRFPKTKLLWDGKAMRFTNNEKANEFIKPYFRKGWELKDV
ncbi:MAG: Gfo/Idh/MocA family oxidoreductase [Verrucomicrobiota bacterium]